MITGFDIYLLTRADYIQLVFLTFGTISAIGSIILAIIVGINKSFGDDISFEKKILKWCVPITLFLLLVGILTPSSKEIAAIYLVPKIVNNEQVQQVPENAMKVLNLKLQEWIKDLEEKK